MKRIFSLLLAALMLVSAVPTALATNDYSQGTQVVYESKGSESYTITVPAQLAPGGNGTVTLSGTWADNRIVTVTADSTVTLKNSIKETDTKTLNVNFAGGISEKGSNTTSQTFTKGISVDGITDALFGTWSGKFNYNVIIKTETSSLPDGAYYMNVATMTMYSEMPTIANDYDAFLYGDYLYMYNTESNPYGWIVGLATEDFEMYGLKISDVIPNYDYATRDQETYDPILESIGDKPIASLYCTFENCTNLTKAPVIPSNTMNLYYTFYGCTSLVTAPEIPSGVEAMVYTFYGCTSLATAPEIPSGVEAMGGTFSGCTALTGEISIPCSLASRNYTYTDCPATITYYHIDGCDGSCGQ